VRRLIVVNVLIFAVLASAVGLAYYGYSYTADASTRDLKILQDTMRELAVEKVGGIESLIVDSDQRLFDAIRLDNLAGLGGVVENTHPWVHSVIVLDDNLTVVPDGYKVVGEGSKDFLEMFTKDIVPTLPLVTLAIGVRGHTFGEWNGQRFLFSYMNLVWGDRIYHVVLEENWPAIITSAFPTFLPRNTPRLYKIIDDVTGVTQYGVPQLDVPPAQIVSQPFVDTFDRWTLQVAQKDTSASLARGRRRAIDFVLIGISLSVILASVVFFALAIRRERRANELKSEFISNVSHELKTPLSIISMFGEMLAAGRTKSPQQATEYAEIIWRESVRLARLIDNVLDFAKIERGVDVYEFAEADLGDVVARALELSVHRLQKAEMTLSSKIEPDLPAVRLDANAVTLAVLNLIDNAIKYAAAGKKIEVELRRDEGALVLDVRDFGPGIEEDEHEAIFERFYRARAVRLKPIRGSGIGLALVQHIARAHGGDATVTSKPGRGATFSVWVPIEEAGEA